MHSPLATNGIDLSCAPPGRDAHAARKYKADLSLCDGSTVLFEDISALASPASGIEREFLFCTRRVCDASRQCLAGSIRLNRCCTVFRDLRGTRLCLLTRTKQYIEIYAPCPSLLCYRAPRVTDGTHAWLPFLLPFLCLHAQVDQSLAPPSRIVIPGQDLSLIHI